MQHIPNRINKKWSTIRQTIVKLHNAKNKERVLKRKPDRKNRLLDESQAGIKIAERNISSLRNANDTTLMTESEEELKSILMKVKGE